MKLSLIYRFLGIAVLLLFSFSCASDLDFDQVNDLKLKPVVVANLAYFNVEARDFVSSGSEQPILIEQTTSDIFNDSFFRRRIEKVELLFELENTINRAYIVDLLFLDSNDQIIHNTNLNIAASLGLVIKTSKPEAFEGADLDILKKTTKIVFSLRILAGPQLSPNSLGSLKFRSAATAYIVVE